LAEVKVVKEFVSPSFVGGPPAGVRRMSFLGGRAVSSFSVKLARAMLGISLAMMLTTDTIAGIIFTVAGTGAAGYNSDGISATQAMLNRPIGVAVDGTGNVYIADSNNHRIRLVDDRWFRRATIAVMIALICYSFYVQRVFLT